MNPTRPTHALVSFGYNGSLLIPLDRLEFFLNTITSDPFCGCYERYAAVTDGKVDPGKRVQAQPDIQLITVNYEDMEKIPLLAAESRASEAGKEKDTWVRYYQDEKKKADKANADLVTLQAKFESLQRKVNGLLGEVQVDPINADTEDFGPL